MLLRLWPPHFQLLGKAILAQLAELAYFGGLQCRDFYDESYRGLGRVKKCFRGEDDKVTFLVPSNLDYPASREIASMVRIIESPDNGKYEY